MTEVDSHSDNTRIIRALCGPGGAVRVQDPHEVNDPYYEAGAHPDIVERVWDELGRAVPASCRKLLCGRPVLVHGDTGAVLAVCLGTSYCLRVTTAALPAALRAGCRTAHTWSDGTTTDLAHDFGPNWVFGVWATDEPEWLRAVGAAFARTGTGA